MSSADLCDLPLPCGGRLDTLSISQAPAVFDLYRRCQDYFLLQDGEAATASDAYELFTDVPPAKRPEDQFVIGCWLDTDLIGVAAVLTDYPNDHDWYLGLLLLDPAVRGCGLGRAIYTSIERWSAEHGARHMLLSVIETNEPALRFWRSLNFEPVRVVEAATFKRKLHVRQELARHL